jgi:hypothetical protein
MEQPAEQVNQLDQQDITNDVSYQYMIIGTISAIFIVTPHLNEPL